MAGSGHAKRPSTGCGWPRVVVRAGLRLLRAGAVVVPGRPGCGVWCRSGGRSPCRRAPILIGSYKRRVSIRRMKDVDVFGRLPDLAADVAPKTLLTEFERVLARAFPAVDGTKRVRRQARSLQVSFPEFEGLYVDAVPARPWTSPLGFTAWELRRTTC